MLPRCCFAAGFPTGSFGQRVRFELGQGLPAAPVVQTIGPPKPLENGAACDPRGADASWSESPDRAGSLSLVGQGRQPGLASSVIPTERRYTMARFKVATVDR